MKKTAILAAAAVAIALALANTPQALAADKYGNATCPPYVAGAISGYSEQSVLTNFMYLSVGSLEKAGVGFSRMEIDTKYKSAFWFAQSNSLRTANGFCKPE